jgi:O-antigen chain-terminating methyltransferase
MKISKEEVLNMVSRQFDNAQSDELSSVLREFEAHQPRRFLDASVSRYRFSDFMDFYDEDFVRNTYLAVLKRDVDIQGLGERLNQLRIDKVSRLDLLGRLRYSSEGKKHNVVIDGLLYRFIIERLARVPIIGVAVRLFKGILALATLDRNIEHLNGLTASVTNLAIEREKKITEHYDGVLKDIRRYIVKSNSKKNIEKD